MNVFSPILHISLLWWSPRRLKCTLMPQPKTTSGIQAFKCCQSSHAEPLFVSFCVLMKSKHWLVKLFFIMGNQRSQWGKHTIVLSFLYPCHCNTHPNSKLGHLSMIAWIFLLEQIQVSFWMCEQHQLAFPVVFLFLTSLHLHFT